MGSAEGHEGVTTPGGERTVVGTIKSPSFYV